MMSPLGERRTRGGERERAGREERERVWRGEKDAHQVNWERGAKSDRGGGKGRRSRMCRSRSRYPLREAARGKEVEDVERRRRRQCSDKEESGGGGGVVTRRRGRRVVEEEEEEAR